MKTTSAALLIVLLLTTAGRAEPLSPPPDAATTFTTRDDLTQAMAHKRQHERRKVIAGSVLIAVGVVVGVGLIAGGAYVTRHSEGDDGYPLLEGAVLAGPGATVLTGFAIAGGLTLADGLSEERKLPRAQLIGAGVTPVQGGAVASAAIRF